MIQVYHHKNFMGATKPILKSQLVLVAEVETNNLEEAFQLTNTIDDCWWYNKKVSPKFTGEGCRSTSVGDVLQMEDGSYHTVNSIGFNPVVVELNQ